MVGVGTRKFRLEAGYLMGLGTIETLKHRSPAGERTHAR
jgi:hypothetical protein